MHTCLCQTCLASSDCTSFRCVMGMELMGTMWVRISRRIYHVSSSNFCRFSSNLFAFFSLHRKIASPRQAVQVQLTSCWVLRSNTETNAQCIHASSSRFGQSSFWYRIKVSEDSECPSDSFHSAVQLALQFYSIGIQYSQRMLVIRGVCFIRMIGRRVVLRSRRCRRIISRACPWRKNVCSPSVAELIR